MVMNESDVYLFKEREPGDKKLAEDTPIKIEMMDGKPRMKAVEVGAVTADVALAKTALARATLFVPPGGKSPVLNRGYHDEMEAFAHAIRVPGSEVRCTGKVALADAVMALTANVAFKTREKIKFKQAWYDANSGEAPDTA